MSQPQMNMGGPVGGQQMNAGTPNSGGAVASTADSIKRLNTAIYDHLLRNNQYDVARLYLKHNDIDTKLKDSPSQRGNQQNGIDDGTDGEYKDRPDDLPMPGPPFGDGPFLADWWLSFWDIWQGHRGKGNKSMQSYIQAQRPVNKVRAMGPTMDPSAMQNMRGGPFNGGMPMNGDLKRVAMQRNMTPQQMQQVQVRNAQAMQQNQQAAQMERQASQMDMGGPHSGSPGSGDAPSPKRQRLDGGGIQQMTQGRPGPPGQMPGQVGPPINIPEHVLHRTKDVLRQRGIDPSTMTDQQLQNLAQQPANHQSKSAETYAKSLHQSMSAQLSQAANSDMNKGMPQNTGMGPAVQQGSPMSQVAVDGSDFYNGTRIVNPANGPNNGMGQNGNQTGGNHALQDYQMQLMLLEQQNKKRLLMARQEQDNMAHPGIPGGGNGQFAPGTGMSPQNNRAGDPSPNPMDMQRGTPKLNKPGMSPNGDMIGRNSPVPNMQLDQSHLPPQFRQQNGTMRPPPSSHPMPPMTPDQMRMMQQSGQMMANWPPGQPLPPGMMPGQQPGQGGPPGQGPPNMTPRQGNNQQMAPPPPPAGGAGTQPSSPAQAPAPPTPSQANKPKPGGKKEPAKKGSNKKGANASESEQPPTPTPATPITPKNAKSFNGQPMPNGQPGPQNGVQQVPQGVGQPDMGGAPFGIPGNLDGIDQFSNMSNMSMEFANLDGGDVLDNFDFDSFLNTGGDDGLSGFDANMMFDGSIEAGGDMGN